MRLGMFMMPLHPAHREPSQTLHEDREAVILADRLGFHDVFVGEHLTEKSENVTNSFIFLATLISDTKTIKLATGTSNLSHSHPTLIAAHAAMFDHLAKGRFIFGISPGALASDAEALGILSEDRNKLFAEAIMDLGRLFLRGVVGPLFVGHGTQKLFGWFGGHGLDGTGGFFETKLGLRPGKRHATATPRASPRSAASSAPRGSSRAASASRAIS